MTQIDCFMCALQNPTLEHYTSYKFMDLKATVLAIEELQSNAKSSAAANAVREKYRQQKVHPAEIDN